MSVKRGQLIAFEGIDGCGKSTQLGLLADVAAASGLDPLRTREPTDGPFGRRIRAMARADRRVAPEQELRWFVEDRRAHVAEVISPALAAGRLVLSDRYYLSSVAYQGARGLDWLRILEDSEAEFPLPDLALILQVAPERGLERVETRGSAAEPAFEELDFLRRVASTFDEIDRDYIVRVDGDDEPDRVHERVLSLLAERLGLRF
jgi:dTMP kinase